MEAEFSGLEGPKIDVLGDGGILKVVVQEGIGDCAQLGNVVKIHYTAKLLDGSKVDSSHDTAEGPFEFEIGRARVARGLDEGLKSMREGEMAIFSLRHDYAYGEDGSPPTIPPFATVMFEIELLEVAEAGCASEREMSDSMRLEAARLCKEEGNEYFRSGNFRKAAKKYDKVVTLLRWSDSYSGSDADEARSLLFTALVNVAQARLKLGDSRAAYNAATKAVDMEPHHVKALYWRGQALARLSEFELARADLALASSLEPSNPEIRRQVEAVRHLHQALQDKERIMYRNMFK